MEMHGPGGELSDVLARTVEEARLLGHAHVGTEHLLLSLGATNLGLTEVLRRSDVTLESLRQAVGRVSVREHDGPGPTSRARAVIETAIALASAEQRLPTTDDLLAALMDVPDAVSTMVLHLLGITTTAVTEALGARRVEVPVGPTDLGNRLAQVLGDAHGTVDLGLTLNRRGDREVSVEYARFHRGSAGAALELTLTSSEPIPDEAVSGPVGPTLEVTDDQGTKYELAREVFRVSDPSLAVLLIITPPVPGTARWVRLVAPRLVRYMSDRGPWVQASLDVTLEFAGVRRDPNAGLARHPDAAPLPSSRQRSDVAWEHGTFHVVRETDDLRASPAEAVSLGEHPSAEDMTQVHPLADLYESMQPSARNRLTSVVPISTARTIGDVTVEFVALEIRERSLSIAWRAFGSDARDYHLSPVIALSDDVGTTYAVQDAGGSSGSSRDGWHATGVFVIAPPPTDARSLVLTVYGLTGDEWSSYPGAREALGLAPRPTLATEPVDIVVELDHGRDVSP